MTPLVTEALVMFSINILVTMFLHIFSKNFRTPRHSCNSKASSLRGRAFDITWARTIIPSLNFGYTFDACCPDCCTRLT
jgi:hypothetical protein